MTKINSDDGFAGRGDGEALEGGLKYRHHHLICIRCDRAISVQDDLPEGLEGKLSLLPDSVL